MTFKFRKYGVHKKRVTTWVLDVPCDDIRCGVSKDNAVWMAHGYCKVLHTKLTMCFSSAREAFNEARHMAYILMHNLAEHYSQLSAELNYYIAKCSICGSVLVEQEAYMCDICRAEQGDLL